MSQLFFYANNIGNNENLNYTQDILHSDSFLNIINFIIAVK